MLLRVRCQYDNTLGEHPFSDVLRNRVRRGPLAIRSGVRAIVRGETTSSDVLGAPSAFKPGELVRVKSPDQIAATLDAKKKTRGLTFMPIQWACCGNVYEVETQVRRLLDDDGKAHPVARTVTLKGVHCGLAGDGCGKSCALYFRDEWIEAAHAERTVVDRDVAPFVVRVRGEKDIRRNLDLGGGREGVKFMPEMFQYAGRTFAARRVQKIPEYGVTADVKKPLYILEGLRCTGEIMPGGCDRRCALLWHEQWLEFLT